LAAVLAKSAMMEGASKQGLRWAVKNPQTFGADKVVDQMGNVG